jgi:Uma2 family endonuclease
MSTKIEPLLTVEDLDAMPEDGNRYEIIGGELLMTRSPGKEHQTVTGNLFFLLKTYLVQNPIGQIWIGLGTILSNYDSVIPDLVFVSNPLLDEIARGDRIIGAPDLAIEIVSPGPENSRRDRIAKRQLYGKFGVKEYWIVDPETRSIEVYMLEDETLKLQALYSAQDQLRSNVLPGFSFKVETIFAA